MARINVEVYTMEFDEGGNTIWVQAPGGTVLRIKAAQGLVVRRGCQNPVAHADVYVDGEIEICLPTKPKR